jgi:8-oxo-dGTP diphosphatase
MVDVGQVRVGVAAIVYRAAMVPNRRRVLMGRRKGSHGAGTWAFPGGSQALHEKVAETAARELEEETGMAMAPGRFRKVTFTNDVFVSEGKHFVTLYMDVMWLPTDGDPRIMEPTKCDGWRWVDEAPLPLFLPVENLMKGGFDPWFFASDRGGAA